MSKSNQQATVNRQTLLNSIMAARNEIRRLRGFHEVCRTDPEMVELLSTIEKGYDQVVRRAVELEQGK